MLSNKQIWRKLDTRPNRRSVSRMSQTFDNDNPSHLSAPKCITLIDNEINVKGLNKRKVRFSSNVTILQIPCRNEMKMLYKFLFWSQEDYAAFREETLSEILEFEKGRNAISFVKCDESEQQLYKPTHYNYEEKYSDKIHKECNSPIKNREIFDIDKIEDIIDDIIEEPDIDVVLLQNSVKSMRRVDSVQSLYNHSISKSQQT